MLNKLNSSNRPNRPNRPTCQKELYQKKTRDFNKKNEAK